MAVPSKIKPNNLKLNKKPVFQEEIKAVMLMKFLILLVIVFLPLAFMMLDLSSTFFGQNQLVLKTPKSAADNEYNFSAPIPRENIGNLSDVPAGKIDSLFDNLNK